MFRTGTILLTMAGAITLAPAFSYETASVRADDYEDAREDFIRCPSRS